MSRILGFALVLVTLGLVGLGWMQSAGDAGVLRSEDTPERGVNAVLDKIRGHGFAAEKGDELGH